MQQTDELDEAVLLPALLRGDDGAYATLVRATAGRMLAVARRLLRDEQEAEDAVQDAYVQAFSKLPTFEGNARLTTWLHRIVVNAALMRLRRRKRIREAALEDLLPSFRDDGHFVEPPGAWEEAGDIAQRDELVALMRRSIDALPESYRNVLQLRDIEGLSTRETAQLLDMTENAVKTRLHRARLALRTILDPHMNGQGGH